MSVRLACPILTISYGENRGAITERVGLGSPPPVIVPDVGVTRGGPKRSVPAAPRRVSPSVRRTSTIDSARPDGVRGAILVSAKARDLFTGQAHGAVVLGRGSFDAIVSADRVLRELRHPDRRLGALVGRPVAGGFRAATLALVPDEAERGTLLNLLLDDLPGANLVAGYAAQRDASRSDRRKVPVQYLALVADQCAGWATGATILDATEVDGTVPTPTTAAVPDDPSDAEGWHDRPRMAAGDMRRARRLDVTPDEAEPRLLRFDGHFRDSYLDPIAGEGALHEYSVHGRYDPGAHHVVDIDAEAHVLPWTECPQALASASRLVGMGADDLRATVRADFVGTSTCTHLNDVLRSLADLPILAEYLSAHLSEQTSTATTLEDPPV